MTDRREIRGVAKLENLALFRDFIEEACGSAGADPAACFSLKLAVDEACTNIIVHGYSGGEAGPIGLAYEEDGDRIVVTITDHARPFSPDAVPEADVESDWSHRPLGGLGWHLIRESIDEFEYRPDATAGNRLVLIKRKKPPGA